MAVAGNNVETQTQNFCRFLEEEHLSFASRVFNRISCDESTENTTASLPVTSLRKLNDFIKLLESYFLSTGSWNSVGKILTPLHCARYGWQCISNNVSKCVECGNIFCMPDVLPSNISIVDHLINKAEGALIENHISSCSFKTKPFPATFLKISLESEYKAIRKFFERLLKLAKYVFVAESYNSKIKQKLWLSSIKSLLKQHSSLSCMKNSHFSDLILHFALFGWTCNSVSSDFHYLYCDRCCRKLNTAQHSTEPIDLEKNHRSWCPWLSSPHMGSSVGENTNSHLPAWKCLYNMLLYQATILAATPSEEKSSSGNEEGTNDEKNLNGEHNKAKSKVNNERKRSHNTVDILQSDEEEIAMKGTSRDETSIISISSPDIMEKMKKIESIVQNCL